MINYSELYNLTDPINHKRYRLDPVDEDWMQTLNEWGLFEGQRKPEKTIKLKAAMGQQTADFLWTRLIPLVCISQRVFDLLIINNVSGWSTYPVEVYDRKNNHLPNYYGFAVKSSVGEDINDVDHSRSQIITKPSIVQEGKPSAVYKGLYFDESKWDGSDIFRLIGIIIVSERVRKILTQEKVSNIKFVPLLEYEDDIENVKIIKGGS